MVLLDLSVVDYSSPLKHREAQINVKESAFS